MILVLSKRSISPLWYVTQTASSSPPSLLLPSLHTFILSPDNWPFKISLFHLCFYCPVESACGLLQTGGYADGSGRRWHALECFNASVMHGQFSVVSCLSVWECTGHPVGKKNDKWDPFKFSVFLELVRQKENAFVSKIYKTYFSLKWPNYLRNAVHISFITEHSKAVSHKQECRCSKCRNIHIGSMMASMILLLLLLTVN